MYLPNRIDVAMHNAIYWLLTNNERKWPERI